MIIWCRRTADPFIPEVMNILDELCDLSPNLSLAFSAADAGQFIARLSLLKYRYVLTISRQKHGTSLSEAAPSRRYIQTNERLSRSRHSGEEHYRFLALGSRVFDNLLYGRGGNLEILGTSIISCDRFDCVPRIQCSSRFYDRRRGLIWCLAPSFAVQQWATDERQTLCQDGI